MNKQQPDKEGPAIDRFIELVIVFFVCFAGTYGIWGLTSAPTIQMAMV